MIRVLVVADYPLARAGLAALLGGTDDLQVVGQAPGGGDAELAGLVAESAPDVVLIDLSAADERGLEGLERLLAARPGLPVAILGREASGDGPAQALAAGAHAYLPHEASGEELAASVRAVAAGLVVLHPTAAGTVVEQLLERPRAQPAPGQGDPLTPREIEVLQALAGGLTNRAIARRLGVSENTVKFHVSSILAKLDAASRAEAVALAARRGLLLL